MWKPLRHLVTLLGFATVLTASAHAQSSAAKRGTVGASVTGGITLGILGFALGGVVGNAVADCPVDHQCRTTGILLGAAAGGTLGMALGVHLGNKSRGDFFRSFITGAAVWAGGIGILALGGDGAVLSLALVAVPVLQMVTMVAVERSTARQKEAASRQAHEGITVGITPVLYGTRVGLGGSVVF